LRESRPDGLAAHTEQPLQASLARKPLAPSLRLNFLFDGAGDLIGEQYALRRCQDRQVARRRAPLIGYFTAGRLQRAIAHDS
jgi:hypothetical protein